VKQQLPKLIVLVGSLAGFLSVAVVDLGRTAPGEVTRVHGRLDEIEHGDNCSSCHGGIFEDMGEACLDCHDAITEHIADGAGLHGLLDEAQVGRCALCHSEHNGPGFQLVNVQSFRLAGIDDREQFDHAMLGFELAGKHLELSCIECHTHAEADLVPEGEHRYIGLRPNCASCHEDPHEGEMRQDCATCHVQTGFEVQHFARHEEYWPRAGSHAEAACVDCHAPEGEHSLATLIRLKTSPESRACTACHESPHRDPFIVGNARAKDLPRDSSCALCHDPEVHEFAGDDVNITAEQHAHSGFALADQHTSLSCADCHAADSGEFEDRFPGRSFDDCAQCHESPHGDQFEGDEYSAGRCIACHAPTHFEPHAVTLEVHAEAAIELTGAHTTLDCADCHELDGASEIRQFRGTPKRCENCHSDAHTGYFDSFAAKLEHVKDGDCAACHTTEQFDVIPEPGFRHARFTGFPVRGAHAQSRCEVCHERSALPDEHGRTFGRVEEHFGDVQSCASCHDDPHAGEFDEPGLPATVQGRTSCERCHVETSFRVLQGDFDHGRWTGFELSGRHANTNCSSCHEPIAPGRAQASGRTWGAATGTACNDCHADPHAGQFREQGQVDCGRCHTTARSFTELAFRHNLDAGFRLDGTHATLECAACHEPVRVGEFEVVRYRPLGTECSSCHAMNHDVLRRPRKGNR